MEQTASRQVSPETFAKLADLPVETVWSWIQGRSTVRFLEKDLIRYSSRTVRIIFTPPNASGFHRPRTVSIHKSGRTDTVNVNPIQDAGITGVTHPNAKDIQGDTSLRMVSGEGMPEGFQVFERQTSRNRSASKPAKEG